jgi:hypothetical protein
MNRKIAACVIIGLAAVGCDRPGHKGQGLGAGVDSTALRDTATATPAPAPAPIDTVKDSTQQHSSANQPAKNQTQSGMKNKEGQSTLGPAVKRTRPDANEPVMAKGDTLARSADQRATDSLNRSVLDRLTKQGDSARINGGHDIMPQRAIPIPVPPVPTDSTRPVPTDSTKPTPKDSTHTPPPLPLDTIVKPMRDTTRKDSTQH